MAKLIRFFISLLLVGLTGFMTQVEAQPSDYGYQTGDNMGYASTPQTDKSFEQQSYGRKIGKKVLSGWTNLSLGLLEVPKNIINTTNDSNIFYGLTGGAFKGLINTAGRMGVGIADLLTFLIPTKPIAHPLFIWDDFDADTTYGEVFRVSQSPKINRPPVPMPVPQPVAPVRVTPQMPVEDRSNQYNQETNRKLDHMFKKEMMK
jgi:putative exosortase-associated protein (TIGR04073 family)